MLSWIYENKHWLFEGGGLAFLGLVGGFLVRRFTKKTRPEPIDLELVSRPPAVPPPPSTSNTTLAPLLPAPLLPEPSKTTYAEISQKVSSAPLMMQEAVARGFVGLVVEWQTTLQNFSAHFDGKSVRLMLVVPSEGEGFSYQPVWCEVVLAQHPQLSLLHRDHPIKVLGRVTKVETNSIEIAGLRLVYDIAVKELPKPAPKELPAETKTSKAPTKGRRKSPARPRR